MNAQTQNWVDLCELTAIPQRGARCVEAGENKIAVFRTADDNIFALEDKCPHKDGPLSQGIVHDGCVTCPLHNWVISLETGQAQGADEGEVQTYPIRIENGNVQIDIAKIMG